MYDIALMNGLVWIDQEMKNLNVYLQGERIAKISKDVFEAKEILNLRDSLVMPGLIDPHVHFDLDLGHIKSRDGFLAGSRQAAYGGVTTYIDFLDPVDNPEDLEKAYYKRVNEVGKSYVDYFFHATIKDPKCDLEVFVKKMISLNMHSLKLFTTYSNSGRRTYDKHIIELLRLSDKYKFLLLAHIEDDSLIQLDESFKYTDLLKSRPSIAEERESLKLAGFVKDYGGYLYMVHLSSGNTLEKLKKHFGDILNKRFFIETCPQYIVFTSKALKSDKGYLYTLAPPLRTDVERMKLIKSIDSIFSIGTDHCAFNTDDKINKSLIDMPLGIGGIENSFDVLYYSLGNKIIDKMSKNTSRLYRKLHKAGQIKEGFLANICVYHLDDMVIGESHSDTDHSLYKGLMKKGEFSHLLLRGKYVLKDRLLMKAFGKELV